MKNTKYIPGDLVVSKIHGIGVIQVCSLVGKAIIVHYLNDDITVGSSIDSVEPIPLTKEVLEKNGWSKNEYEVYFKFFNSKMVVSLIERSDDSWNVVVGGTTLIYCKFIHQLQHLLFGLGLPSELKV